MVGGKVDEDSGNEGGGAIMKEVPEHDSEDGRCRVPAQLKSRRVAEATSITGEGIGLMKNIR